MRIVQVHVSMMMITEQFQEGARLDVTCTKGLPSGAVLRSVTMDNPYRDMFTFIYEHPSFDDVPNWKEIPWLVPEYTSGGA
jgi:hypothetical protein